MVSFINVGFGNMIAVHKIIAMVTPDSAPTKRNIQEAKEEGTIIDATHGRKTRTVIYMENGRIVLSALQPETIVNRLQGQISSDDDHV